MLLYFLNKKYQIHIYHRTSEKRNMRLELTHLRDRVSFKTKIYNPIKLMFS